LLKVRARPGTSLGVALGFSAPFALDPRDAVFTTLAAFCPPYGAASPALLFAGAVADRNQSPYAVYTQTARRLTVYTLRQLATAAAQKL